MPCLPLKTNISKTELKSFFPKWISFLYLSNFVNKYLYFCSHLARVLYVIFDSCSLSPSTTGHHWLVHHFHPSCHLCSSHQHSCNSLWLVSVFTVASFQGTAFCTDVRISQGGTYLTEMSSVSSIALLVKYMCLFLALEALHDWYQPSSPTFLLRKWDALLVSSKPLK